MLGIPQSSAYFWRRPAGRYYPAFALAIAWTLAWGLCRWVGLLFTMPAPARHTARLWAFCWGRDESPEPVVCARCGWAGARRWAIGTYQDDGCGDVEGIEECPKCGGEV